MAGSDVAGAIEASRDTGGYFETPQRSGTCFYRCSLTALRYLLKVDGFSIEQQKQFFYGIRLGFVERAAQQISQRVGGALNSSDCRLVKLAVQLTGLAANKLHRRGVMAVGELRAATEYLISVDKLVDDATSEKHSEVVIEVTCVPSHIAPDLFDRDFR